MSTVIIAFEFFGLLVDGPCLSLCNKLMLGQIDWQTNQLSAHVPNEHGKFTPLKAWAQLTRAFLDLVMPTDGIEEYASQLPRFEQHASETAQLYALHFRTLLT